MKIKKINSFLNIEPEVEYKQNDQERNKYILDNAKNLEECGKFKTLL